MAAQPVPTFVVVRIVHPHFDLKLRLSPKAGTVRRRQPDARVEVGQFELAVIADQIDARFVLVILTEIIVRLQLKAGLLVAGHLVGGMEFEPVSAGADAIGFILIRRHGSGLRASQAGPHEKQHK